jgi:hypothetical protein
MKKEKIWIFDLNESMIFRAVAWGILTRPQVGDFQVAIGDKVTVEEKEGNRIIKYSVKQE